MAQPIHARRATVDIFIEANHRLNLSELVFSLWGKLASHLKRVALAFRVYLDRLRIVQVLIF